MRGDETIQFQPTPLQLDQDISGRVTDLPDGPFVPQPGPIPTQVPAQAPDPASLTPPAPKPPPEPSQLGEWLRELFEPIGKALGLAWPVMQWLLIGAATLLAAYAVYRLIAPWLDRRRAARPSSASAQPGDPGWAPDRGEAKALLDEADVLAAEGRYGEAAHLLLQRSVGQIARARPDWVLPASTTREISAIPALPQPARTAFQLIAQRVERSLFALRALDQADWQAARAAYADFALQDLAQERAQDLAR